VKKKKKGAPAKPAKARAEPAGHRPFAALSDLKARIEKDPPRPATTPKATPKPDPVVEDEVLTLHRMMSGVTPLGTPARRIPRSADALPTSAIREHHTRSQQAEDLEADEVHAHLRALVEGGGRFEVDDDGGRVEGRRTDVPQEVLRKLRRGLFPIDARIDLHGFRAEEARERVGRFLGEKRAKGERCVLVVHGRGEHSPRGHGILRGEMAAWLSQGHASVHVAAFATAEPHDGGEGAMYVLLSRS
jgi:DNA-nicking Smr family endonuclease